MFRAALVFSLPAEPSAPGSLHQLLDASARCLTHQEFTHTRACIAMLCLLLERAAADDGGAEGADAAARAHVLDAHGSQIAGSCLLGARAAAAAAGSSRPVPPAVPTATPTAHRAR